MAKFYSSGEDKSREASETRSFSVTHAPRREEEREYEGSSYNIDRYGEEPSERADSIYPHGIALAFYGAARPLVMFFLSLCIVAAGCIIGYKYVDANFLRAVAPEDDTPVTVEIVKGSSLSSISDTLEEAGLVSNSTVFKFYTDFSDMGSKLKAGTYTLTRAMTMDDIILALSRGDNASTVTRFTLTEGQTVESMAESLKSKGIFSGKDGFLSLCESGTGYLSYSFIADLMPVSTDEEREDTEPQTVTAEELAAQKFKAREYMLEGYLFPDTYEIYVGSTEDAVIKKLLDRFAQIFNDVYIKRADELGMTIDEVVILASVIEREATTQDMKKVSAVFHNRLSESMKLESCATVQYLLSERKYNLTQSEIDTDSYYNTYKYPGLPAGPICNPGQNAIEAALYPDEQYMTEGYLYFCSGDPEQSELVFAKTYEEHQTNVGIYRPLWQAYDVRHADD